MSLAIKGTPRGFMPTRRHSGSSKEGWIPCSYYNEFVVPEVYTAGDLCHHRHLTRRLLQTDRVPDVGYMLGGKLYNIDFHRVEPTAAAATLFRDHPEIVFKRNRSSRGRGIVKVTPQELCDVRLDRLPDGVFQTLIRPHAAFESLLPERGPTIRFTTVLGPSGKAELRAAHLRVATLKSQFVAPGSGINVSINLHSGCLVEQGYIASTLQPMKHHPDTGFVFSGHPMPNFSAAADHVLRLHDSFPVSKVIGWDVCIDLHGQLQLFEWNLWWPAIRFLETTSGPHFRGLGWEDLWRQPRD
ncbi:MAG: hypothetical protein RI963_2514 [Planctomycetota bacterium]